MLLGNISIADNFRAAHATHTLSSSVMVTQKDKKKEADQARQRPHTVPYIRLARGLLYIYVILPTLPEQEQLIDGAGVLVMELEEHYRKEKGGSSFLVRPAHNHRRDERPTAMMP